MLNHNLLVCKIVFKKLIEMILMKINEPVTMLTDYLITVYCLWLVFLIEIKGELNLENPMIIGSLLIGSICLLYTSPSPRDRQKSRMPSSA